MELGEAMEIHFNDELEIRTHLRWAEALDILSSRTGFEWCFLDEIDSNKEDLPIARFLDDLDIRCRQGRWFPTNALATIPLDPLHGVGFTGYDVVWCSSAPQPQLLPPSFSLAMSAHGPTTEPPKNPQSRDGEIPWPVVQNWMNKNELSAGLASAEWSILVTV
jgi:hypothetical protein